MYCYWSLHIFRFLDDLIFSISLDGQSPPSLLYNGYQDTFLGLGCGVDHSPPLAPSLKKRQICTSIPSAPTWHVTGQACSTLYVIWATSAKFGLHVSNMKFNTQHETRLSNVYYMCYFTCVFVLYTMCNKYTLIKQEKFTKMQFTTQARVSLFLVQFYKMN